MMRLVAVHLLLLAGLAIHLCLGSVQADTTVNNLLLYGGDSPNIADDIAPTNILGRDNLCVDVKDGRYNNGNPIQVWRCANAQFNQLWTFRSDGTIRSNGKCMTASAPNVGRYVMIYDCPSPATGATKWTLDDSGTIRNPHSGLVLTAGVSKPEPTLTLDVDSNSAIQAWTRVNFTKPAIGCIRGFRELCLQANGVNASLLLADCITVPTQSWVRYGDRTIRLSSNHSLCVTSDGHHVNDHIVLFPCQGMANQRWTFKEDRTILNPYAGLVMDVKESDLPLLEIILNPLRGTLSQQWHICH